MINNMYKTNTVAVRSSSQPRHDEHSSGGGYNEVLQWSCEWENSNHQPHHSAGELHTGEEQHRATFWFQNCPRVLCPISTGFNFSRHTSALCSELSFGCQICGIVRVKYIGRLGCHVLFQHYKWENGRIIFCRWEVNLANGHQGKSPALNLYSNMVVTLVGPIAETTGQKSKNTNYFTYLLENAIVVPRDTQCKWILLVC